MFETSERFRRAVRTSHRAVSFIEILPTGERLPGVLSGSVRLESGGAVRSSISFGLIDPTGRYLDRGLPTDVLSRFGTEVAAWRGVAFSDGTAEVVPLGIFRIEGNVPTERESGFELSITGKDRSSIVARKAPRPIAIRNGTPLNVAIRTIVSSMYPAAIFELAENPWTTGTMLIEQGSNPWEQATKLAEASGLVLFVDRLGVFRTLPGLDPASPAVWLYDEGEQCTFTDPPQVDRGTGQPVPNGFIVKGTSAGSNSVGAYAEAWDMDPRSPTYRYGAYGENAEIVQTDKAKTNGQAQLAADLLLRRALGKSVSMSFNSIVNPALDPYDVVWVRRTKVGVNAPFFISNLDIPLTVAETSGGTLGKHLTNEEAAIEAQIGDLVGNGGLS